MDLAQSSYTSFPSAEIAGSMSHHHALLILLFVLDLVAVNIPRYFVMNMLSEKKRFIKLCLGSGNVFVEYLLSIEVTLFGLQQPIEPVALVLTCDPKT